MKKTIFVILVMLFTLPLFSQQRISSLDNLIVDDYDLSTLTGADTSYVFYFANFTTLDVCWSIQIFWDGVTGTGTIELFVSDNGLRWVDYHATLYNTSITGASDDAGWEDDIFAWKYGKLVVTKGTLTAGTLTALANY